MKTTLTICLSLLLITGGLELNQYFKDNTHAAGRFNLPAGLQRYWFKRNKKELIRDNVYVNPIRNAIDNSLRFVLCGI